MYYNGFSLPVKMDDQMNELCRLYPQPTADLPIYKKYKEANRLWLKELYTQNYIKK